MKVALGVVSVVVIVLGVTYLVVFARTSRDDRRAARSARPTGGWLVVVGIAAAVAFVAAIVVVVGSIRGERNDVASFVLMTGLGVNIGLQLFQLRAARSARLA